MIHETGNLYKIIMVSYGILRQVLNKTQSENDEVERNVTFINLCGLTQLAYCFPSFSFLIHKMGLL